MSLDLAPHGGCLEAALQDDDTGEARRAGRLGAVSPAVQERPLGQLAHSHEGDRELLAGEPVREAVGQLPLRIAEATSASTTT